MSVYRTHKCDALTQKNVGEVVKLSGWVFRRRDHGGVVFIDLRDNYGITQIVFHPENAGAEMIEEITHTSLESVITVEGKVVAREEGQVNPAMATGEIEVDVNTLTVISKVQKMPYNISDESIPEELRLKNRFLDLRTERMQNIMHLRSDFIASLRRRMWEKGFREFTTPILTASSPEGARDFLVPSRLHPGKFFALPQAPQQFKQLLMVSGFDKYFQIAPCFRDEDPRADRHPLDFYQLDIEMSFVEQEDIFNLAQEVVGGAFEEFANWNGHNRRLTSPQEWPRIPYEEAMLKYGCDKPDLRNPIEIADVSDVWEKTDFAVFKNIVAAGGFVRAIPGPKAAEQPRSWFDKLGSWAQKELNAPAAPGYISLKDGEFKGPLFKFLGEENTKEIFDRCKLGEGDVVFFIAAKEPALNKLAAPLRNRIGEDLDLFEKDVFRFAWIVDYPMFEKGDDGKLDFSHNPFSMPQGGIDALAGEPLNVKAFQYDLVCNGYELASGAVRNHLPELMYKAFGMVGYGPEVVEKEFGNMISAFKHGAPPHAGMALGVERLVMLLADTANIREVIAFPANGQGEDLLMSAPSEVSPQQLRELSLILNKPKES